MEQARDVPNDEQTTEHVPSQEDIANSSLINIDKLNAILRAAQLKIFFGFMLAGFFGLFLGKELSSVYLSAFQIALYTFLCLVGLFLMYQGIHYILNVRKVACYLKTIMPEIPTKLTDIALMAHKSAKAVATDLTFFFEKSYLYGKFDENLQIITLTGNKASEDKTDSI